MTKFDKSYYCDKVIHNMQTQILNFKVLIEQDEDDFFVASVPAVPGCYSQGKTYEKVIENIKDALKLCLEEAGENSSYANRINWPREEKKDDRFIGVANI